MLVRRISRTTVRHMACKERGCRSTGIQGNSGVFINKKQYVFQSRTNVRGLLTHVQHITFSFWRFDEGSERNKQQGTHIPGGIGGTLDLQELIIQRHH